MPREPDWDLDRVKGEKAEELVRRMRGAILLGTIEVKRDDEARKTGNFFVEYECNTAAGWKPSGIATTKANSWAIVIWPMVFVLPVWVLRQLHEKALAGGRTATGGRAGSHPTHGTLLPVATIVPEAIQFVEEPIEEAA